MPSDAGRFLLPPPCAVEMESLKYTKFVRFLGPMRRFEFRVARKQVKLLKRG
jgi:hypothetical protein